MGLGKTVSTLQAIHLLKYDYLALDRVLVVAPLNVAKYTWSEEVLEWDELSFLKCSKVLGERAEREEALRQRADIYIINYDNLLWLLSYYKHKLPFDMIVFDESRHLKSRASVRFAELKQAFKKSKQLKRIIELTGTPTPNGLEDLWSQIYLLDSGERLGRFITHYRKKYFDSEKIYGASSPWAMEYVAKDDSIEKVTKQVSDICFCLVNKHKEPYIEIPKTFDLTPRVQKMYDKMLRDKVIDIGDSFIKAHNNKYLKLFQLSNGAVYRDKSHNVYELPYEDNIKLQLLGSLLESLGDENAIIFYHFQCDIDMILKAYGKDYEICVPKREPKNSQWKSKYDKGKIKILLAHPASCGEGLNLQFGASVVIWYSLPIGNLSDLLQANARLVRPGQKRLVKIYYLIANNTLDVVNAETLKIKDYNMDKVKQYLIDLQDRVKNLCQN